MNCPYCKSKDVSIYEIDIKTNISTFMCYNCKRSFEERDIKDCGKQIFHYGDNYPEYPTDNDPRYKAKEIQEHIKFKNMGIVPKANKDDIINLWIDLWEFSKNFKIEEENEKNIN